MPGAVLVAPVASRTSFAQERFGAFQGRGELPQALQGVHRRPARIGSATVVHDRAGGTAGDEQKDQKEQWGRADKAHA
jgi:hypothetical protein